jgi:hypothetical protein
MGIHRRRVNKLAESEASIQAAQSNAAASTSKKVPRSPTFSWKQYLTSVVLACAFWTLVQYLAKYAGHFAATKHT